MDIVVIGGAIASILGSGFGGWLIKAYSARKDAHLKTIELLARQKEAERLEEARVKEAARLEEARINEARRWEEALRLDHDRAEKLNEANIGKLEAEMSLKIKQSEMLLINQLQEERNYANVRVDELTKLIMEERRQSSEERRAAELKIDALNNRIRKMEDFLKKNNLPIPD